MIDDQRKVFSLQSLEAKSCHASWHAVSDRSFFSRAIALFLSAALGWQGSGCPFSIKEQGPVANLGARQIAQLAAKFRHSMNRRPSVERHYGPSGGTLDDDPAILSEDFEERFEARSGTTSPVLHPATHDAPIASAVTLSARDQPTIARPGPARGLCRFRC
jgi:hypothetical protein